jgi:DNA-binding NarL/FixJ family response regulator
MAGAEHTKRPARNARAARLRVMLMARNAAFCAALKATGCAERWDVEVHAIGPGAIRLIRSNPPDVALVEVQRPRLSAIDCVRELKDLVPGLPVIMLAHRTESRDVASAVLAGATGYLLEPVSPAQLRDAVLSVLRGSAALCEEAQTALLSCFQPASLSTKTRSLSARQVEIVTWLDCGLSNKEIADCLGISHHTVHVHLASLYRALGVHKRKEAVHAFFDHCLRHFSESPPPAPRGGGTRLRQVSRWHCRTNSALQLAITANPFITHF